MKILLLGDDGRAHALTWKLFNSSLAGELIAAPGNGGTSALVPSADLDLVDAAAIARWAFDENIDIILPADSRPLDAGLVDEAISLQVGVCGPSQRSVGLERSRCQAKEFMLRHKLPTAPGRTFTDRATAEKYLATQPLPVMIKADHSAGGEAIYADRYTALEGLHDLFAAYAPDGGSQGVVIETALQGARVVMSAFTDGRTVVPLLPARLYDRVEEHDRGAPAYAIGAHTGNSTFARKLADYLYQQLLKPLVAGLERDQLPFWGIVGIDCIITDQGPRLTALRASMHEGEAQVVLPRLEDDLLPWIQAMIARRLHERPAPQWAPTASAGIGLFARGYPHHFPVGGPIGGLERLDEGVMTFHSHTENPAGLRYISQREGIATGLFGGLVPAGLPLFGGGAASGGALRSTGGLVMTVVATGATLAGARGRALINAERITFEGRTFRGDIGATEFG